MEEPPNPLELLRAAHPDIAAESPAEWLAETGGVLEAIPYHWLYWPEVLEVRGAVFVDLPGGGRREIDERLVRVIDGGGPGRPLEAWERLVDSFNYFEIGPLFSLWRGPQDTSEEAQLALASLLIAPWEARLRGDFPGRTFDVRIAPPEPELEVCVEVRQTTPRLVPPAGW
ncbi:hypothetical protein [Streptomyces mayteni]